MSLFFHVQLQSNGPDGPDDANWSWRSTTVAFGHGAAGIVADVLVEDYSGQVRTRVTRDDFGLPARLAEPLAIALYRTCGSAMRQADCDFGESVCDVEGMIRRVFYRSDAQALLRQLRLVIADARPKDPLSLPCP